jgi:3-hydroxyisobutyrate dehydrogenase-like beta-hydroxyacid dehydrogenase
MRLGLIGFGEAGYAIANSLDRSATIAVFDFAATGDGRGPRIRARAAGAGVMLVSDIRDLADCADIVISVVVSNAAVSAARSIAPVLSQHAIYADFNSTGPATKQQLADAVAVSGCQFVDVAVMAGVPQHGHKVPLLAAGPGASAFAARLAPLGSDVEVIGGAVGAASAVKMFRSVLLNGLNSLILECAAAASQYGATERVFASAGESMGMDLMRFANRTTPRQIEHAERRAHEMEEVTATLRDCGVDALMSEACARQLRTFVARGLPAKLGDGSRLSDALALVREG